MAGTGTGVDPTGGTALGGVGAGAGTGATAGTVSESGQTGDTPVQADAAGMFAPLIVASALAEVASIR